MTGRSDTVDAPAKGLWLTLLCVTLVGYALAGKYWAYLGVPPLFIGEIVLVCGVVSGILFGTWRGLLDLPAVWFLMLLVGWGIIRIGPDVASHGVDALRDGVIWGYSAFAVLVFVHIASAPRRLESLISSYGRFASVFALVMPALWMVARVVPGADGRGALAELPKGGDVMVNAAGILAFWIAGFAGPIGMFRILTLSALVVLVGSYDRAGLLSFLAVFALCFTLRPRKRVLWRMMAVGVYGLVLLAATNVRIQMPGREREISFMQFVTNLASITGDTRTGDLDETKEWRLEWWSDIFDYTLRGKYLWTGKGFGISLADDDGYQVQDDASLRSPHNGHLTMLARGGLPGLGLWLLVQVSWAGGIFSAFLRSRRAGDHVWEDLFLFVGAYWLAFMINASFDVYLEGPVGGICYWSLFGVGLAAMSLYKHNPELLQPPPENNSPETAP